MSGDSRDLWSDQIVLTSMVPPVAILREQATLLREKTKGLVLGEVESLEQPAEEVDEYLKEAFASAPPTVQTHTLYLVVPGLDNYQYSLLSVKHDFQAYPCSGYYHPTHKEGNPVASLSNEKAFLDWLRSALSASPTARIIVALMSRVQDVGES